MNENIKTKVVVLGSGPAGYSAAFRCSDLKLETILIERYNNLGGVCLNVGCIPSKALLHLAQLIEEIRLSKKCGIIYNEPKIDINQIQLWKQKIIGKLTNGLLKMSKDRKIKIVNGIAEFIDSHKISVKNKDKTTIIEFNYAIIATGSHSKKISFIPYDDSRVWDSTDALELKEIPKKMLVIGSGIIGLEISTIYYALGTKIDIVESSDQIMTAVDRDIINFYIKQTKNKFNFILKSEIVDIDNKVDGIYVTIKNDVSKIKERYDVVLVAIGRLPNTNLINISNIGINTDNNGFIITDKQMKSNVPHIYAVGDVSGYPMLAHKGVHEGHIAAEVISGLQHYFDPKVIPTIVYTNPNIAWVGITEKEAKEKNIDIETAIFPWSASGRAITSNFTDGMTKLIFNKKTNCIIGGSTIGVNSGELLGEIALAIEMGCDAEDIALTIHGHPTFHESINMAAKIYTKTITDLPNIKL